MPRVAVTAESTLFQEQSSSDSRPYRQGVDYIRAVWFADQIRVTGNPVCDPVAMTKVNLVVEPSPQGQLFTAGPALMSVICQRRRDTFRGDVVSGVLLRTGGHLRPQVIPKVVPFRSEIGGGAIDRFQEHQQIRLLERGQRVRNGPAPQRGQCVQREHVGQGLGLAAVQVRRVIVDAEQRRRLEAIHPKRRAGGGVVADLYGVSNIERPHILEIVDG